jgi:thiol-disulfide isomerase/thioredoxin
MMTRTRVGFPGLVAVLGFILIVPSACARRPPITNLGCAPGPPEVEAAYQASDDLWAECGYASVCWRRKIAEAQNLRDRFPDQILAHKVLEATIRWAPSSVPDYEAIRQSFREEYETRARRNPRNPAYPYLACRLQDDLPKARELVATALAIDPGFGWAHYAAVVVEMGARPSEDTKRQARAHVDAFARACSGRTHELLSLLSYGEDRSAWESHAAWLREAVTPEKGKVRELPTLWELEFKFAAPRDYPILRERVRRDLGTLRTLDRQGDRNWLAALRKGYEIAGDEAERQSADDLWLARFPCTGDATQILLARYEKEHGKPPENDTDAAREWLARSASWVEPWLERCPNETLLWQVRLAQLGSWDAAPHALVEKAADRVLAMLGDPAGGRVAGVYLDKGIRLDRIEQLIDGDRRWIDERWRRAKAYGLEGETLRSETRNRLAALFSNQGLRVRLALARRDLGAVDLALATLEAKRKDLDAAASKPQERSRWSEAQLWRLRAERDALAGRSEEALADYGRALEKHPEDRKAQKSARELYAKLRGSEAGFGAWLQSSEQAAKTAAQEVTRAVRRPLPELSLPDLSGRTWSSADLRGKAVLLNFWATWCGPCRAELPNVQRLFEKTKRRRDVAILTVSVDDNPGLVEPFLSQEKYTFPVLVGGAGSFLKWAPGGIPQTYVVDPGGTIVQEQFGFGGDGERWIKAAEESLDAALAGVRSPNSGLSRIGK